MGSKQVLTNYRVVLYPTNTLETYFPGRFENKNIKKDCEMMYQQCLRHIDDINKYASGVEVDDKKVCEYCGSVWTETTPHNGGCCDQDIVDMDNYITNETKHFMKLGATPIDDIPENYN